MRNNRLENKRRRTEEHKNNCIKELRCLPPLPQHNIIQIQERVEAINNKCMCVGNHHTRGRLRWLFNAWMDWDLGSDQIWFLSEI